MKTSSNNLQYLWRKDFEKMKRHEAKCNLLEDKIVTKFAGIISHNCIDNCKIDVQTDISNCESSDDKYNGVLCPETKLTSEDMERYWKTISHSFLKGRTIPYLALIMQPNCMSKYCCNYMYLVDRIAPVEHPKKANPYTAVVF